MRNRLFWKIGLLYLLVLLLVVAAVDTYVVRALKTEFLNAAYSQLESLMRLAAARAPQSSDASLLREWTAWCGQSGARATLIADGGRVVADSAEDPAAMENHLPRPEIREAFLNGTGRAVRRSPTLKADLVYLAQRCELTGAPPVVLRLSLPLHRLEEARFEFRARLWGFSALILIAAGAVSLLFFRSVSRRIRRLNEFSRRVADGDFRPLPMESGRDELSDLSNTLGQTAGKLDRTIKTLTEERNRSAAVLSSMEEGVAVIGSDNRIIYCNSGFCRDAGISGLACEGRPVMELIRHSDLLSMIQKALEGGAPIHGEVVVGSVRTRTFAATAAPISFEGATTGAVMVLHDITEMRRLERARRDFIANISHEFKTPLTAIQGFAETLLGGALDDAQNRRRFLEIIREHALRLGRLTDDLLKLAQIEAGKLRQEMRPVTVPAILDPCMDLTRIEAGRKGLALEGDYGGDLPAVTGDVRLLQEIVQNLLDNAVRYTPAGGRIRVQTRVEGSEVVISIADTGIGIPRAEQDRIFERFYRADAARSRESGGTGLGLAIVKHLVEAHGGRIVVRSEVGQGSTFSVRLPAVF